MTAELPTRFHLQRHRDVSGISGTGIVALGVRWPDGTASVRWLGARPSIVFWDSMADAEAVHGHAGATEIVWDQEQPSASVLGEIAAERVRQDAKFGEQNHPDGTGTVEQQKYAESARRWCQTAFGSGYGTWSDVLAEEVAEANAERDPAKLRAELVQVAAVAAAWIEAIDRRTGRQP
ncbi:hypothetical protein ACFWY6_12765 [Streptomyces sp. NPDC059037]|uniref:hypothetical protein n=1 Tax=Streptomyces sp. NPDC059037 TaxID=3346710 RepID=UPI0036812DFB